VAPRKVIIVDDDEAVLDSLEALLLAEGFDVEAFASARDFIEKPFDPDLLVAAIRESLARRASSGEVVDAEVSRRLNSLTPREHEVLEQLVLGRSNQAIGRQLGISPRTVEIHRARVMEKMCADSLSQLVRMAFAAGIDPAATAT
jgi:two-component system response regulator FixJ